MTLPKPRRRKTLTAGHFSRGKRSSSLRLSARRVMHLAMGRGTTCPGSGQFGLAQRRRGPHLSAMQPFLASMAYGVLNERAFEPSLNLAARKVFMPGSNAVRHSSGEHPRWISGSCWSQGIAPVGPRSPEWFCLVWFSRGFRRVCRRLRRISGAALARRRTLRFGRREASRISKVWGSAAKRAAVRIKGEVVWIEAGRRGMVAAVRRRRASRRSELPASGPRGRADRRQFVGRFQSRFRNDATDRRPRRS